VLATRDPGPQLWRPAVLLPGSVPAQGEIHGPRPNERQPAPMPLRVVPVPLRHAFPIQPEAHPAQGRSPRPQPGLQHPGKQRADRPPGTEPSRAFDTLMRPPLAPLPATRLSPPSRLPSPGFEPRPQPPDARPMPNFRHDDRAGQVHPGFEPASRHDRGHATRPGDAERAPAARYERNHQAPEHDKPQGVPGPLQRAGMAPP
jgi:hypothetical protein